MKAIRTLITKIKLKTSQIGPYIDRNPYRSFYIVLGILFLLIVASNILGTPRVEPKKEAEVVKEVQLYAIGAAPKMKVLAQVEKSGVVTITALTPGVVQYINPSVGAVVARGQNLLGLSSNYQGGNTSSLSRQLAQVQYDNALATKDLQKEIVGKQKELAEKSDVNADELRSITDKSIVETNNLIALNDQIISSLDASIASLENTNVGGVNDALILSTRQMKSQFLSGTNMARQGLRMAEFSSAGDKAPAQLSNLQKDVAIKQLDIQQKMIDMNIEISGIQLKIARVVEAMMYPSSPLSGTVERIFVKVGEAVNPGTPLVQISGAATKSIMAVAYVSADVARNVSKTEESVVSINGSVSFKAHPVYISRDAVSGSLHAVYFAVPPDYASNVTEKGFITVELPIGYAGTGSAIPFIPLDSVYQTKDTNYVYVNREGMAQSLSIDLGNVFGSYVEVTKGLKLGDTVIVNRNIIAGDKVTGDLQ